MKQVITAQDIKKLIGKFIIELNANDPIVLDDKDHKVNIPFYMEKRVDFITVVPYNGRAEKSNEPKKTIQVCSLYAESHAYTDEEFVNWFNDIKSDRVKESMPNAQDGERYHRLLFASELETLFRWMAKRHY